MFSLALGLGILAALKFKEVSEIQAIEIPRTSWWQFIFNFALATVSLLLIIRFLKFKKGKEIVFKFLFLSATFFGGWFVLSLWLSDLLALGLIMFLIFWWIKKPLVLAHNILVILGIAGVGSIIGLSLESWMVIALLVVFSIYDFIAVYKTKHMVEMAKEMVESRAILGLIVPQTISGFKEELKEVKPGGEFLILGGGDIAFPLIFSASLVSSGIFSSLIVALFSLLGLFVGFCFFLKQKVRQPIPALPPIALFSIIGFFISRLI